MSQVLQLGSVASHLKDMMKLGQVGIKDKTQKENYDKISDYIDSNFEGTVKNLIKII